LLFLVYFLSFRHHLFISRDFPTFVADENQASLSRDVWIFREIISFKNQLVKIAEAFNYQQNF